MSKSNAIKASLSVLVLATCAYLCSGYLEELPRLMSAKPSGLMLIGIVHSLTLLLQGQTLRIGLRPFGRTLSVSRGFALTVMGSYANLLLPRSGIATTAAYLKHRCQIPLIDFSSVTLFNGILFSFCSSLLAAVLILFPLNVSGTPSWLVLPLLCFVVISAGASAFRWNLLQIPAHFKFPVWNKLCHSSANLTQSGSAFQLLLLHLVMTLLRGLRLYLACWALAIPVNPFGVLLASALGDLIFLFAFTPAAIGFRECAITFAAASMGVSPELALSVAIFDRLAFSGTVILLAQLVIGWAVKAKPAEEVASTTECPGELA